MYKTYQFRLSIKDDNYDACEPQITKFHAEISCQVSFDVLRRL
jgi:hypothetical protein